MSKDYFNNNHINQIIKSGLDRAVKTCQHSKYAYAIMSKRNPLDIRIINNHVTWFNSYVASSYQLIDPVIIKSMNRVEDFSWDEKIMIASELTLPKIFDAAKRHDIKTGHTFVLHDYKNNLAVLSIFEDLDGNAFKNKIAENRERLQLLLIETHQKMLSLYQEIEHTNPAQMPMITSRENEILHWSSTGKTSQEIAIILGIKPSTVKFHTKNILRKLGVSNTKHAIKLAIELQLIKPLSCL